MYANSFAGNIFRRVFSRAVFVFGLAALSLAAFSLLGHGAGYGARDASAAPGSSQGSAPSQKTAPKPKKQDPIRITSNRMEAYTKKNFVDFIGDVVAIQGEMQIKSDKLRVFFQKKKSAAGKKSGTQTRRNQKNTGKIPAPTPGTSVERIVATGNVLVNQGKGKFASGERLDYNERTGVAILTGNPRAWEGNNQIVGDKITIYVREERTVVHGSKSRRVNVTLFPSGEETSAPARK